MFAIASLAAIVILGVVIFFQERKQRKLEYEIEVQRITNESLLERLKTSNQSSRQLISHTNKLDRQLWKRNQAIHRWSNN